MTIVNFNGTPMASSFLDYDFTLSQFIYASMLNGLDEFAAATGAANATLSTLDTSVNTLGNATIVSLLMNSGIGNVGLWDINRNTTGFDLPTTSVWEFALRGNDQIKLSGTIGTVFGDVASYAGTMPLICGNDSIRVEAATMPASGNSFIYGDAISVPNSDPVYFGNDIIDVRSASVTGANLFILVGDSGTFVEEGLATYGADTIVGSQASDVILGDYFVDFLAGNGPIISALIAAEAGGNDRLFGYGSNDLLFGGGGADYIDGGAGEDQIRGGQGNDRILGGADGDILYGDGGNDIVQGGAGNDLFFAGATPETADRLEGGDGDDDYVIGTALNTIVETNADLLSGGNDTVRFESLISTTYTLGANVENLVLSSQADGLLLNGSGNALANSISGDINDNILDGGIDALIDTLDGGGGNDTFLLGSNSNDVVIDGAGIDTIVSSISRSLTAFATIERLTLTGTSAINGNGNALANIITGNAATNVLDGGIDALADILAGGLGNDVYIIRTASDDIVELAGGGTDRATVALSFALAAGDDIEFLEISSVLPNTAINLTGNEIGQRITGNNAANIIAGGGGADTIVAGLGNDTLSGGMGSDVFLFNSATGVGTPGLANVDTITDFNVVDDIIHLENSLLDTFLTLSEGALNPAFFKASTTGFSMDADDRITYNTTTGALYYDSNGNVAGGAKLIAVLSTKPVLTAADFLVV
jgi:Ca2+-binding RTX toxin-like protein